MPRKYHPKYGKELRAGLRKDGKSIDEVCILWNVSIDDYNFWRSKYPKFEEAHRLGARDQAAWWYKLQREGAQRNIDVNAGMVNFAMKNIEGVKWRDVPEAVEHQERTVNRIQITIAPQQALPESIQRIIEHGSTDEED